MIDARPVDFHVHLDLYPDMMAAYQHCADIGCTTLAMTTTPRAFRRNHDLSEISPHINAALGLHPQVIGERSSEISMFEQLAGSTRFIGEIGLDAGRKYYSTFDLQLAFFDRALRVCYEQGNKIISIHSVRCARHVLDAIERSRSFENCKIVLHWFSASKSEIRRAVDLGCFFSVNEQLLTTPPGLRLTGLAPQDRLLSETDGPFLLRQGSVVAAGDVTIAAQRLGELVGLSRGETMALFARNARRILDN